MTEESQLDLLHIQRILKVLESLEHVDVPHGLVVVEDVNVALHLGLALNLPMASIIRRQAAIVTCEETRRLLKEHRRS